MIKNNILRKILVSVSALLIIISLSNCADDAKVKIRVSKNNFGKINDTLSADLYTLTNANGVKVSVTNFGGIVTKIIIPDKNGNFGDIVLGYDSVEGYVEDSSFLGALIGRYGNRIAKGKFTLNGETYQLATNNDPNHLHGGVLGFDKVVWDIKSFEKENESGLILEYQADDGEEGYPGNLRVTVVYTLTDNDELKIDYLAMTDKSTVCNLTNHSYFNLKDAGASSILDHELQIMADRFTPVDETLIPTGELQTVEGTPFDFRTPVKIGKSINSDDEQIKRGLGYDHNFVLSDEMKELRQVAKVSEATTGRILEVYTEEPGIQFYSGNFLNGSITGKNKTVYNYRTGFCLETQHFPDSPNWPEFPSTILNPGEIYQTSTIYKFSVMK